MSARVKTKEWKETDTETDTENREVVSRRRLEKLAWKTGTETQFVCVTERLSVSVRHG